MTAQMPSSKAPRVAALTSVRHGQRFLERWIAHYGAQIGFENLYIMLDGHDQAPPISDPSVNLRWFEHEPMPRLKGDKHRARRASQLAHELLKSYDIVIGTDVDEFLMPDPRVFAGLADYFTRTPVDGHASAIGIDIARHKTLESPLDWDKPFLCQRRYGVISDRYTKASVLAKPYDWGSGFHRVKGQKLRLAPALFLLHFGSVDEAETEARSQNAERVSHGWSNHQARRNAVSDVITQNTPCPADEAFEIAAKQLAKPRSLYAWNKPKPLSPDLVVELPDAFCGLV